MVLASRIGLAGYGAKETLMEGTLHVSASLQLLREFKSEVRTGTRGRRGPLAPFERAGSPTRFSPDAFWVLQRLVGWPAVRVP